MAGGSGHLCLKWNNHSTAFLKSISNIQIKEKFCDATIACQGKYFPVHRIILSTCSDYFEEMFERMQCQHPYIVFKDIEPHEMELLLNYMYQGEVNVIQERLPSLIKAAEALKIKGLAVPDDIPSSKESSKKRSSSSHDSSPPRKRLDERRRKHSPVRSEEFNQGSVDQRDSSSTPTPIEDVEAKTIKQEPFDNNEYGDGILQSGFSGLSSEVPTEPSQSTDSSEKVFVDFPISDSGTSFVKSEVEYPVEQSYAEQQSSSWSDYSAGGSVLPNLPTEDMPRQDDIREGIYEAENIGPNLRYGTAMGMPSSYFTNSSRKRCDKFVKCPQCEYKTLNRGHLKDHIISKHSKERKFKCLTCFKRFKLKQTLLRHIRIHTGEKPFQCTTCNMRFNESSNLKKHFEKHHKYVTLST